MFLLTNMVIEQRVYRNHGEKTWSHSLYLQFVLQFTVLMLKNEEEIENDLGSTGLVSGTPIVANIVQ
jgi:hypothetical protein